MVEIPPTYTYYTELVHHNLYIYGQQVSGASAAFLTRGKNFSIDLSLTIKDIFPFAAALYHSNGIQAKCFDVQNLLRIGEPAVNQNVFCLMLSSQSGFQNLYHNCDGFLACHESAFSGNCSLIYLVARPHRLKPTTNS